MAISKKNPEGYLDMTAYEAIKKTDKEINNMNIFPGDIFEVRMQNGVSRQFLIVATNARTSVALSLLNDEELPLQVLSNVPKYTDPCRIQYIFNDAVTDYIKSIPEKDLEEIKSRIAEELGISAKVVEKVVEKPAEKVVEKVTEKATDNRVEIERDIYKNLYYELIQKMMENKA